jgi:xanthine/CO dehydrogenase XdhC/CoxF family maturation factor
VTPEEIAVAITAELIALRRHSEAPLPHLRYTRQAAADPGSPAESAADLRKN